MRVAWERIHSEPRKAFDPSTAQETDFTAELHEVLRNDLLEDESVPGFTKDMFHGVIRAEEARQDMYVAIDAATEVLERQLKKFRSKYITRSHRGELPLETPQTEPDEEDMEVQIVRNKRFELRPMSPEDAAMQMEALGHDFYMFYNAKSDQVNVIYKRRDGHYGLLEPHIS